MLNQYSPSFCLAGRTIQKKFSASESDSKASAMGFSRRIFTLAIRVVGPSLLHH
jgi:hypothetical protein